MISDILCEMLWGLTDLKTSNSLTLTKTVSDIKEYLISPDPKDTHLSILREEIDEFVEDIEALVHEDDGSVLQIKDEANRLIFKFNDIKESDP